MNRPDIAISTPWYRPRTLVLNFAVLLLAAACLVTGARAQSENAGDAIDPPGRVGRISLLAGPVTLTDLRAGTQEEAILNWPITGAYRLSTGQRGRAEVRIGSTVIRLDDDTTVDFARLDDQFMQIAVLRGTAAVRVRNRDLLDELELVTQRERIALDEVGQYRVEVDVVPGLTSVTAFAGRARLVSGNSTFVISNGQRGEVTAPPLTRFQLVAATADNFDNWTAARDAQDDAIRSAAYVSRETTGIEILDDYGDWRSVDSYGAVWFPRTVPSGWAPYRYGRWADISPWGWTWIDEAPWGFAPTHYGRWAVIGGVWGWVPGVVVPRPVYAPALVGWFGAPGVSIGVSIGAPIGWFPLGPREVYVPPYRYSPRYLRVVNVQHVTHVDRITVVQTPRYVHRDRDRSTWVPGDRFGRPDPVQRHLRQPPSEWRRYIGTPQPPANVPHTKRRQDFDSRRASPDASEARPAVPVRPQPAETPRARPAPRSPSEEAAAPRGRGESGAAPRTDRPVAPRVIETPRARPAPPPTSELPVHRGRGELGAVPRGERGPTPRIAAPPMVTPVPPSAPAQHVAPPVVRERSRPRENAAPQVQAPAARERGRQDPPAQKSHPEQGRDRADDRDQGRATGRAPRAMTQ